MHDSWRPPSAAVSASLDWIYWLLEGPGPAVLPHFFEHSRAGGPHGLPSLLPVRLQPLALVQVTCRHDNMVHLQELCTDATCSQADPHVRMHGPCRRHVSTCPRPSLASARHHSLASARVSCPSRCGASVLATDRKPVHCTDAVCLLVTRVPFACVQWRCSTMP